MTETRDSLERFERLGRHLQAELTEHDVERLVRGGAERRQRRRLRQSLGIGLALGAASMTLVFLLLRWPSSDGAPGTAPQATRTPVAAPVGSTAAAPSAAPLSSQMFAFSDQSRAEALDARTLLTVVEDAPARVHLRLDRGRARFEVTRRPGRSFSVLAGEVTVNVIGTNFAVEVVADRVGVSVESGVVEVDWALGQKRLAAGESGWFPPLVMSGQPEVVMPDSSAPANDARVQATNAPHPGSSAGSPVSRAQELLAEVDAVRSQGQPARAAELLRQILRDHPDDPRAPLAAFTLGRVLLNDLGRPREAAAAFHQVRLKAPSSPFAEDALAREVEAWSRASDPESAAALARTYLERYPSGRHVRRVKALANIQ